jgi:hypothetical protein
MSVHTSSRLGYFAMRNKVAIHQPNFLPWLGFFKKWAEADIFVLLDDVQIPVKGGSWINRTQILQNGQGKWLTAPISREELNHKKLSDVLLVSDASWKRKMQEQFRHSYSRCDYAADCTKLLEKNFNTENPNLLDMNLQGLREIGDLLQLDWGRVVLSSSLGITSSGTQRLVEIVKALSGDTYLSGDGAQGYQMNGAFPDAGLSLEFLDFTHPIYIQRGSNNFKPGLSVLDAIANIGAEETRALLYDDKNRGKE